MRTITEKKSGPVHDWRTTDDDEMGLGKTIQAIAACALLHRLGGALVRCEERYPEEGSHSVLVVVVERDAPLYVERLADIHAELFGPGKTDPLAPVQIEVVARAG